MLATPGVFKAPVIGTAWRGGSASSPSTAAPTNAADALGPAAEALAAGEARGDLSRGAADPRPEPWPEKAKTGAVRLALRTGAPIVPVAMEGAHRVRRPAQLVSSLLTTSSCDPRSRPRSASRSTCVHWSTVRRHRRDPPRHRHRVVEVDRSGRAAPGRAGPCRVRCRPRARLTHPRSKTRPRTLSGMGRGFGVTAAVDHGVVAELAREAERLGYTSFWFNDIPHAEGLASVAAAVEATTSIPLSVGVIRSMHDRRQRSPSGSPPWESRVSGCGSASAAVTAPMPSPVCAPVSASCKALPPR